MELSLIMGQDCLLMEFFRRFQQNSDDRKICTRSDEVLTDKFPRSNLSLQIETNNQRSPASAAFSVIYYGPRPQSEMKWLFLFRF